MLQTQQPVLQHKHVAIGTFCMELHRDIDMINILESCYVTHHFCCACHEATIYLELDVHSTI